MVLDDEAGPVPVLRRHGLKAVLPEPLAGVDHEDAVAIQSDE